MATFPTPITAENFPRAWQYVSRKYRWAVKKKAIKKYALPVGQLLFFPAFWITALFGMCLYAPQMVKSMIARVPQLFSVWCWLGTSFPTVITDVTSQIIFACCALLLIPFAAFLLAAILIVLLYHPKVPTLSGTASKDAETLWTLSRHAQLNALHRERDIAGSLALITGIAAVALICCGIFLVAIPTGIPLFSEVSLMENLQFFVLCLILVFSYGLLNLPVSLLMKAFSRCKVPQNLASSAEVYCQSVRRTSGAEPVSAPVVQEPAVPTPEETTT